MKKTLLIVCAVFLALSGCRKTETETASNASVPPLRIGVLSIADSAVLLIAQRDGIYEKHGANVEVIEFGSAPEQSKAAEAGQIDAIMTDMVVQSLINKGGRTLKTVLVALGDTVTQGKFIIASAKGNLHNSVETIGGAKIAISENTMMEFLLDSYCAELGIDMQTIEKVNIPSISLRLEVLLAAKDIDAAILPEPLGDFALLQGAGALIDDTRLNVNLSQAVITVDQAYIEAYRDNVQKFVQAYAETASLINKNPDLYRDAVLEIARVPEALKQTYSLPVYSEKSITERPLFDRVQKWMVQKGLLTIENEYETLVDASFTDAQ